MTSDAAPSAESLDRIEPHAARGALRALLAGRMAPGVALVRLLSVTGSLAAVEAIVLPLAAGERVPGSPLSELAALLADREVCVRAASLLATHPAPGETGGSPDAAVAACREFFDHAVRQSEEASVALYSLGDPAALARATAEVMELLESRGLLPPGGAALELGCGIGRFLAPLAGRLREVWGIDVSAGMLAAARRRCAGLANVRLACSSGRDLDLSADGCFDLALAVDSFPYVFQAGRETMDSHFAGMARVLRPGGRLAILNFSYRDDLAADRADFAALCDRFRFAILACGERPLRLWDGAAFFARKPREHGEVYSRASRR
jgi:SAM-dependent methyltransferase